MFTGGMASLVIWLSVVAIGCTLVLHWTRAFADLLWLVVLRPGLTAPVTLAIFLAISFLVELFLGFPAFSPAAVAAALLLAPILAVRAVDAIAHLLEAEKDRAGQRLDRPVRGFVFRQLWARMREGYEARAIEP